MPVREAARGLEAAGREVKTDRSLQAGRRNVKKSKSFVPRRFWRWCNTSRLAHAASKARGCFELTSAKALASVFQARYVSIALCFQANDLHRGFNEEARGDKRTTHTCLRILHRCQNDAHTQFPNAT
jgi:hypothetical protein